ncbi:hypothetical protein Tcan_10316 [Toxocara canis]|uniref:SH3 domain-containing protein n=1 Tax=Toxocara canis TaxID=6265 RepID=A0A0B2VQM2_TOXCA|nr:hypothetical protein Tcan_10316 [Toxocara canis]
MSGFSISLEVALNRTLVKIINWSRLSQAFSQCLWYAVYWSAYENINCRQVRRVQSENTALSNDGSLRMNEMIAKALAEFDDIDEHAESTTLQPQVTRQCRSGISAQGSSSREGAAHCTQVEARHGTDVSHSRKTFALARAAEDWNGDPDKEQLPTKQGEILKIMERRRTTCKCLNSAGQSGWVPTQKLLRMAPRDHK